MADRRLHGAACGSASPSAVPESCPRRFALVKAALEIGYGIKHAAAWTNYGAS